MSSLNPLVADGTSTLSGNSGYVNQVDPSTFILGWKQFNASQMDTLGGTGFQVLQLNGSGQWVVGLLNTLAIPSASFPPNKFAQSGTNGQVVQISSGSAVWGAFPSSSFLYNEVLSTGTLTTATLYSAPPICSKITITSTGTYSFTWSVIFFNASGGTLSRMESGLAISGGSFLALNFGQGKTKDDKSSSAGIKHAGLTQTGNIKITITFVPPLGIDYVVGLYFESSAGSVTAVNRLYAQKLS